jgi:hypothetical protein
MRSLRFTRLNGVSSHFSPPPSREASLGTRVLSLEGPTNGLAYAYKKQTPRGPWTAQDAHFLDRRCSQGG